ncbi:MAG TPA: tetratricopeptide repeat protein [Candidatus Acidoferrum sp.]|nr:tetratricopeptide repeat protein [Candidatus Acidoferrum sp.]
MRRLWLAIILLFLAPCVLAAADNPVVKAQEQFNAGNFSAAIITLRGAAQALPENAAIYYWLGRCYFELRKYDQAITDGEHAVKLAPNNSEFLLWLGRAYGREAEVGHNFWMALRSKDSLEDAVKADPANIPARRDLAEFYSEAPWIVGGSKKKARDEVAAIAAVDPIQGELAQAEYDRKNGAEQKAEDELKAVLQSKPKTVAEYYEVADFFASHPDPALLQQAVDGAATIAPSDPRLLYYHGVTLALEGENLDEAETYLKAYLARTPNRSDYPRAPTPAHGWATFMKSREGEWMRLNNIRSHFNSIRRASLPSRA